MNNKVLAAIAGLFFSLISFSAFADGNYGDLKRAGCEADSHSTIVVNGVIHQIAVDCRKGYSFEAENIKTEVVLLKEGYSFSLEQKGLVDLGKKPIIELSVFIPNYKAELSGITITFLDISGDEELTLEGKSITPNGAFSLKLFSTITEDKIKFRVEIKSIFIPGDSETTA